ncbi:MAG: FKBP-type peptidyl-prolyl cis-trans isomerase [Prevotella sp.]|jgi:FKBP-type peptidyl-prolyl cis-trans isomerase FklB|nr:FKBP-type peptidyl-prolyl cis-trans isomerase [Prevotella sp.]
MKKSLLFTFALCAVLSPMALSAQKKASLQKPIVPEKPVLKTEMDSLSYAFGAMLYEQGLSIYLQQLGVVIDTAGVTSPVRLDSINKANSKNKIEFIAGIKEGMNASEEKSAFNAGVSVGGQILKLMAPQLIQQLYGEDSTEKLNSEAFLSAMESSLNGDKLEIENPTELFNEKMQEAQAKLQVKQEEAEIAEFADQIAEGDRFMEENKSKAGVVTLPDGLQYIIMEKGTGAIPTATDRVKVHYLGTLIDGTVFDSSLDRGEPAVFGVNQVIKGWTEALQLMPVGSKWTIYIPYDLAYGARGAGEKVKPYSNLIFEVQLLGIE